MDHKGNCLKFKAKFSLCCGLTAVALLLLHAVARQAALTVAERSSDPPSSSAMYAVGIDSPGVFSEPELTAFLEPLRSSSLEELHKTNLGTWAARMGMNNIGTLSNGDKMLMKERGSVYQMQGELFSYYLNCYLELWNAPPTALGCASAIDGKTILAAPADAPNSDRNNASTCFIISKYVEGLQDDVYMPDHATSLDAVSRSPRELNRLLEWSDLILFDFLTAHTDRLLDNNLPLAPYVDLIVPLKRVPNLAKSSSGELVFIDHEATFHRSYATARLSSVKRRRLFYYLSTLSVFRRRTLERVCGLCAESDPAAALEEYISKYDSESLRIVSRLEQEDRTEFKERLLQVCSNTCHLLQKTLAS